MLQFGQLYPHFQSILPTQPYSFLDLGCGTSDFSLKLWKESRTPIIIYLVDFSIEASRYSQRLFCDANCVPHGQLKNRTDTILNSNQPEKQQLRQYEVSFIQASAQHLPFEKNSINVILDKGMSQLLQK